MYHWLDSLVKEYDGKLLSGEYPDRTIEWCVITDEWTNYIVIDSRLDVQHTRFTIAHELGHIIDQSIGLWGKYAEQKASNIAIHLLVSDKQIQDALDDWHRDIPTLSSIFWMPYKWMEERITQFKKKYNLE